MTILLLYPVENIGRKYEVVHLSQLEALSLIDRKLALVLTVAVRKQFSSRIRFAALTK